MFFPSTPAQLDPGVIPHNKTHVKMHRCHKLDSVVVFKHLEFFFLFRPSKLFYKKTRNKWHLTLDRKNASHFIAI